MKSCAGLKTIIVKVFIPGADKETQRGLFCFFGSTSHSKCEISSFGYNLCNLMFTKIGLILKLPDAYFSHGILLSALVRSLFVFIRVGLVKLPVARDSLKGNRWCMTQASYPFRALLNKHIQIFPAILIFHIARFD